MMLTDLADVCRAAGLTVIETPGWRTRGALDRNSRVRGMTDVLGVTCHHTAGSPHGNAPSFTVVRDGRADLAGPLAHLLLARDGTVYVIAAGLCNHAGVSRRAAYENPHRIGIEAENTGLASDPWPGVQITAYARLCAALARHYGFPVAEVLGHKETCSPVGRKSDPSFAMPAFRVRVATYYATKPTTQEDTVTPQDIEAIAERVVTKLLDAEIPTVDAAQGTTPEQHRITYKLGGAGGLLARLIRLTALTQDWVRTTGKKVTTKEDPA